jgi:hypothetical protein
LTWDEFAKELGISAVVGAVTGGMASSADKIKILSNSAF